MGCDVPSTVMHQRQNPLTVWIPAGVAMNVLITISNISRRNSTLHSIEYTVLQVHNHLATSFVPFHSPLWYGMITRLRNVCLSCVLRMLFSSHNTIYIHTRLPLYLRMSMSIMYGCADCYVGWNEHRCIAIFLS